MRTPCVLLIFLDFCIEIDGWCFVKCWWVRFGGGGGGGGDWS
ncbi:hypothetical protein HanIR_Chr06g0269331 [Helianthus annuus]|nr:hypothetical protein HanIR_Chr06g0269331 [Helianthus annuus]